MFVIKHPPNQPRAPTLRERNAAFHSKQHRQQISRRAQRVDAVGFSNLLTSPELLGVTESHLPEHRERLYPPTVTLSRGSACPSLWWPV
jgi:hypothetical protein